MDLNPVTVALLVAIGGILARIIDIIKLITSLFGFKKKVNGNTEVYKLENSTLQRTSNGRFGFSFVEPRTWDRFDPANGDGNKYVHPTMPDVVYIASGIYDVFNETDMYSAINNHISYLAKHKRFKLLLSRESGSYCFDIHEQNMICIERIEGWRLKYMFKDKNSKKMLTIIEYRCNFNGVNFTIHCQAPTKQYEYFED